MASKNPKTIKETLFEMEVARFQAWWAAMVRINGYGDTYRDVAAQAWEQALDNPRRYEGLAQRITEER